MTDEFVIYEQAIALKELGFNEKCMAKYNSWSTLFIREEPEPSEKEVLAPLYQQAFRWFREKYELYQAVYADKRADDLTLLYKVHVYKLDEELSEYAYRWAKTYEEAEQVCLDKLIEIVKNK